MQAAANDALCRTTTLRMPRTNAGGSDSIQTDTNETENNSNDEMLGPLLSRSTARARCLRYAKQCECVLSLLAIDFAQRASLCSRCASTSVSGLLCSVVTFARVVAVARALVCSLSSSLSLSCCGRRATRRPCCLAARLRSPTRLALIGALTDCCTDRNLPSSLSAPASATTLTRSRAFLLRFDLN